MATYSLGTTIRIAGSVSSGYVPASNEYVVATYTNTTGNAEAVVSVYIAPGTAVPASFAGAGTSNFFCAVKFINSP